MAIREILLLGNPELRKESKRIKNFNSNRFKTYCCELKVAQIKTSNTETQRHVQKALCFLCASVPPCRSFVDASAEMGANRIY